MTTRELLVLDAPAKLGLRSPENGAPDFPALLLRPVAGSAQCAGMEPIISDPDLDPEGIAAERVVRCLAATFGKRPAG